MTRKLPNQNKNNKKTVKRTKATKVTEVQQAEIKKPKTSYLFFVVLFAFGILLFLLLISRGGGVTQPHSTSVFTSIPYGTNGIEDDKSLQKGTFDFSGFIGLVVIILIIAVIFCVMDSLRRHMMNGMLK